jgi:hypothetical protein
MMLQLWIFIFMFLTWADDTTKPEATTTEPKGISSPQEQPAEPAPVVDSPSPVSLTPIKTQTKKEFSGKELDELGKVPAFVEWESIPSAAYYNLTISQLKDFKKGRTFKVNKNSHHLMVYPNKEYYWKVEAFDKSNKRLPFESDPSELITKYKEDGTFTRSYPEPDMSPPPTIPEKTVVVAPNAVIINDKGAFPSWLKSNRFWVATQFQVLKMEQTHTVLSSLSTTGTQFPTTDLHFQSRRYNDKVSAELFFQQVVGSFKTDDAGVSLLQNDFRWMSYGLRTRYLVKQMDLFHKNTEIEPYIGFERTKTPYFRQLSPTAITPQNIELTNVKLGLHTNFMDSSPLGYFADISYAQSVAATGDGMSSMDLNSGYFIEGQFGAQYFIKDKGLFAHLAAKFHHGVVKETIVTTTLLTSNGERSFLGLAAVLGIGIVF